MSDVGLHQKYIAVGVLGDYIKGLDWMRCFVYNVDHFQPKVGIVNVLYPENLLAYMQLQIYKY